MGSLLRLFSSCSGNMSQLLLNMQSNKAPGVRPRDYFCCLHSKWVEIYFLRSATSIAFLPFQAVTNKTSPSRVWHSSTEAPSDFFRLLSKQNYNSPGSRAVQTQAVHHLAPPWNIPWKWLSLSLQPAQWLDTGAAGWRRAGALPGAEHGLLPILLPMKALSFPATYVS